MCFALSTLLNAQNEKIVDSLQQLIKQEKVQDTIKVKAYNDLGIQFAFSNPKLAKEYINNALSLAIKVDAKRGIAGAYNCLGIVDYYQKDYDAALLNFQKALKINEDLEHLWGQAAALNQIGAVQNLKNDYSSAIVSFNKAGSIFETMKDSLAWAKSISNIGVAYRKMEYHKKAIENYLKAADIYNSVNNPEGTAGVHLSIAIIFNKQGDYNKALDYLKEALPLVENTGNTRLLSRILRVMGTSYSQLKDYDKALYYCNKALEYYKNDKDKKRIRSIQIELGNIYYEKEDYTKALEYQKEALKNFDLNSNHSIVASIQNAIAKSYLKRNQRSEAINYATKALETSEGVDDLEGQRDANQTLAKIAQQEGESAKALQYYMDFQKLSDSLSVKENQKQVRELTTIYKTEQNEAQIASQKTDIELLNLQNKNKTQLLIFGFLGLLVLFGAIMFHRSFLNAKKREQAQQEFSQELIKTQEQERTRIAKDLHDGVGQQIIHLKMKAENNNQTELSGLAHNALEEVRSISRDLYPVVLAKLGLSDSIEQLLLELDEETDMFVSVEIDDVNTSFNETESLNLYRFIQESVNNVLKHAKAKTLVVNILKQSDGIKILIKDNGEGFEVSDKITQNSLGLKTMAERISMLKGSFAIKSKKTEGTSILVQIPV